MIINLLAVIVYLLLLVLSPVPRAAMEGLREKETSMSRRYLPIPHGPYSRT